MNREHTLRVKVKYPDRMYEAAEKIRSLIEGVGGITEVPLVKFRNGSHKKQVLVCIRHNDGMNEMVKKIIGAVVNGFEGWGSNGWFKIEVSKLKKRCLTRRPVHSRRRPCQIGR